MWMESETASDNDIRFAILIVQPACQFGHPQRPVDAKRMFNRWRKDGVKLTPNVRVKVYIYGLKASEDVLDLEFAWDRYDEAVDGPLVHHKSELKSTLGSVTQHALIKLYLDNIFDETLVPKEDFPELLKDIARNPDAVDLVWARFQKEFSKLQRRYPNLNTITAIKYLIL